MYLNRIRKLPIGIENFEKLRREDFYYIDKTGLIGELLYSWGEVNLFTRPRRFGKSLNMSMLKYFFEYGCDSGLFEGLEIAKEQELCEKYMGKFPVVSITLKGINADSYEAARGMLCSVIGKEALRFQFLLESGELSEREKAQYQQLVEVGKEGETAFVMADGVLESSLLTLTGLLHKHYGKQTILLIDEYDVPLDKANQAGYYDEMAALIGNLFGMVLKTNESLYFAVLTGCLRVAKESIFTGLNNFNVLSITNARFEEYFGFTDREVRKMLGDYGLIGKYELVKTWYDGYRFGRADVYCPWDVINYCAQLCVDPNALPRAFWANTSGNDILKVFLQKAKASTKREIEKLVEGGIVTKKVNEELTYRDLYKSIDNLWSVLFTTGYLTHRGTDDGRFYKLVVPNLELKEIFIDQILEWMSEEIQKDPGRLDMLTRAFMKADVETIENELNAFLAKTISIRDTAARQGAKENFYQGILIGLLSYREDWDVFSNAESGEGYSDILVESEEERVGIIIEVKYQGKGRLETGCETALNQIERAGYESRLRQDGMTEVLKYGIAFCKKNCMVRMPQ